MTVHAVSLNKINNRATGWVPHLAALGCCLIAILALFWREVMSAVEVWWIYPTYSHCFLVLPISGWLIWEKRDQLRVQSPTLASFALLGLPFVLVLWLVGEIGAINEVRQFAVIGFVQIALLAMLGVQIYRQILFPALFLFFLVPVGQYLVPPMQIFATWFTDGGLTLLGISHYTEGTFIDMPNGRFEIAEACAGLRFLIATVTLGVLFAHLMYRTWWKTAVFLVACVAIPLIGNGFRCIGILVLAYLTDNQLAAGADHIVYGWIFNILILFVVFFFGSRFRDSVPDVPVARLDDTKPAMSAVATLGMALALVTGISAGPAFAYWREYRPLSLATTQQSIAIAADGWSATPFSSAWRPSFESADLVLLGGMAKTGATSAPVDLAIFYYRRAFEGHSPSEGENNRLWDSSSWQPAGAGSAQAQIGTTPVAFAEAVIASPQGKRLIWWSYWSDGRFTTSGTRMKLMQLKTSLLGQEGAAMVAASAPIEGSLEDARAQLASAFAAMKGFPQQLVSLGQAPQPSAATQP